MTAAFLAAIATPDWAHRAACLGLDPNLFHPEVGQSHAAAKAVCARCPVRAECLDHAIRNGERFGVWGGTSEHERRGLRRAWADANGVNLKAEGRRVIIKHGNVESYQTCLRRNGAACALCRDAWRRWREYARDGEGVA